MLPPQPQVSLPTAKKGTFQGFSRPFWRRRLARLESEGKVHGGVAVGARAGALILDAESHDEANQILQGLPAWGIAKWELTPLQSFETRRGHDRQALEDLEATLQQ